MSKKIIAEVNVIDRLMYMLEEGSVSHLARQDETFASYIDQLYESLKNQSRALKRRTKTPV